MFHAKRYHENFYGTYVRRAAATSLSFLVLALHYDVGDQNNKQNSYYCGNCYAC